MRLLLFENPLYQIPDPFLRPVVVREAISNLQGSSFLGYAALFWPYHLLLVEDSEFLGPSRPEVMLDKKQLDELAELGIRVCSMESGGTP